MKKLYYLGQPGDGYGWGVANTNLVKALSKYCTVEVSTMRDKFDAPVFSPISSGTLKPDAKFDAPRKLGYCFTEWPLPDDAHRNARFWDVVFAGSQWNVERLVASGVKRVQVLQQGVDFERFKPLPIPPNKAFVVFSGGKYEYRKGQDYVVAAMRHFMTQRPDVVLLTAWHNPWPATMRSMDKSWLIKSIESQWEGFDPKRVIQIPAIPNEKTPEIYQQAHVGLFPNRCEAGTNLVMSEFMACSRPVIATYATGHRDVLNGEGPMRLTTGSYDGAGWFNTPVSDILYWLEYAYQHRDELPARGEQCRKLIEPFTWDACARKVVSAAFD